MMLRLPLLILLPIAVGACAGAEPAAPPAGFYWTSMTGTRIHGGEAAARANAMAMAAAGQVKRCYRSPRIPSVGRQIVTHLRVRYSIDGRLEEAPRFLSQEASPLRTRLMRCPWPGPPPWPCFAARR